MTCTQAALYWHHDHGNNVGLRAASQSTNTDGGSSPAEAAPYRRLRNRFIS
jgi:hypothetical protein